MKKQFILFLFFGSIMIVEGCILRAGCGDDFPNFYDFSDLEIEYPDGELAVTGDSVRLIVFEDDIDYITRSLPGGFLSSSFATDCDVGWDGKKFAIVDMEITSTQDWDENHPAGTSLKDLIAFGIADEEGVLNYNQTLDAVDVFPLINEGYPVKVPTPSLSDFHRFIISLTKDNGEVVTRTSAIIRWQE